MLPIDGRRRGMAFAGFTCVSYTMSSGSCLFLRSETKYENRFDSYSSMSCDTNYLGLFYKCRGSDER